MATAKKLPSGKWRVRAYVGKDKDGKNIYKSFTDTDKRRCERIAAQYLDVHRKVVDADAFGTAMESYIESREALLSPATIRGYKNIQKQLTTQYRAFCDLSVVDIQQDILQSLINEMVMFVSPKTIRNRHGLITAVIKSKGYMPPIVKLPERVRPDLRIPDANDVKKLLEAAEGTELEIPIMLAAFAPMRRGEIVALKMEDIDGNVIHVKRAVVEDSDGNLVEKSPKTYESDRFIPMPQFVMDKIREKGYIVDIQKPRILTMRFERLVKRCGLDGIRFHDLRHFGASYLHSIGVPEQYILERGGWHTGGVMKNVYRHSLASEEDRINKNVVKKLTKSFS